MRHSALLAVALGALFSSTAVLVQAQAQDQPTQQNAAPKPETSQPAAPAPGGAQENRKSSGTNDQSGPSSATPTTSTDGQGDKATHSVPGRGGKEEPGSHAPTQAQADAPFVNGALNVPGAPTDSQTVPAKFSQRNDAIDHIPIMAMPALALTDEQKKAIVASVKSANEPVQPTAAKPGEELPWQIALHSLGVAAEDPALGRFKYVRDQDRVLLVDAPNRTVVAEIKD